ncbi:hypothetical protein AB205_0112930 [Aquarana catesbeiana]|uniref:Uncharacterized protein n=1 Tax=Aquarana catesbeiana TaxID=8400 RepID=A0A2G9SID1_AQUCT|nr:hypothetical protein AB205_0112930 [Aquarana catesbeiana]
MLDYQKISIYHRLYVAQNVNCLGLQSKEENIFQLTMTGISSFHRKCIHLFCAPGT